MALDLSMPVLVVDDHTIMVRIIQKLLTSIGFSNLDEAGSGAAALAKLGAKRYGLVICDWNMEPMSGFDLLTKVRSGEEKMRAMRFIMVTADPKTENVVAAKRAGVDNYIVKPFTAETLKQKILAAFDD